MESRQLSDWIPISHSVVKIIHFEIQPDPKFGEHQHFFGVGDDNCVWKLDLDGSWHRWDDCDVPVTSIKIRKLNYHNDMIEIFGLGRDDQAIWRRTWNDWSTNPMTEKGRF